MNRREFLRRFGAVAAVAAATPLGALIDQPPLIGVDFAAGEDFGVIAVDQAYAPRTNFAALSDHAKRLWSKRLWDDLQASQQATQLLREPYCADCAMMGRITPATTIERHNCRVRSLCRECREIEFDDNRRYQRNWSRYVQSERALEHRRERSLIGHA